VFSLRCVYIEILAALHPDEVSDQLLDGPSYQTLDYLSYSFIGLGAGYPVLCVNEIIMTMLRHDPEQRPSALEVTANFMVCRVAKSTSMTRAVGRCICGFRERGRRQESNLK
jgi:hypothetical protein